MMKKYYLKRYYPIYSAGDKLCIGIPNSSEYIKVRNTQKNYHDIERLINNGLLKDEIKFCKIYKELLKKNMYHEYSSSQNIFKENVRNELFFEYLNLSNYNKSLNDILDTMILIFGAGAGGSTLIYLLAQFGFKNLIIVDNDIVNVHDTLKTLIFKKQDIGKHKVDCLTKEIKKNFSTDVTSIKSLPASRKEILEIIKSVKPDFIVKACDPDLSFRYYLNEICFSEKIPFIYMSYAYERINVGPLFIPGVTASDSEIEKVNIVNRGKDFSFLNHKKLFKNYTIHPSVSFNINILSSLVLKEIIFYLLGQFEYSLSINKEVFFIPLTYKVLFRDLSKL